MRDVSLWFLIIAIPVSLFIGFAAAMWYVTYQIRKMMGIKSWKEFAKQIKKSQEIQKKMAKGDINTMLEEINKDPHLKKQMEELRRKFGGSKNNFQP